MKDGARGDCSDIGDGNIPGGGIHKPYKNGGKLMFEANFGKEEYLSVKWVFTKMH